MSKRKQPKVCNDLVQDLIDNAYGEIEQLKEELDDWYNNLPESFQNGEKGERLQEAVQILEQAYDNGPPELPDNDAVSELRGTYNYPTKKRLSRSDRCSLAVTMLNAAEASIRAHIDVLEESDDDAHTDLLSELENVADVLESACSELDSVEFPGMYG